MAGFIKAGPGSSWKLKDIHIKNTEVGIEGAEGSHISSSEVSFENVQEPYKVRGTAKVTGNRISSDPKQRQSKNSAFGYQKVIGPPLPVFCPNCKAIFPSRNYKFGGRFFESWDNEEPCPECRFEHAKLSEGLFDLSKEAVRVLSAPDITFAMLAAIEKVATDVRTGVATPEQAAEKLDQISAPVGDLWRRALAVGATTIGLLVGVIGTYYARESVVLGRRQVVLGEQQVEIGREQLRLQKDSNTDKILEDVLSQLKQCIFTLNGLKHYDPKPSVDENDPGNPAKNEAPSETGSVKLKPKRKTKARNIRQKLDAERRKAFGRARH